MVGLKVGLAFRLNIWFRLRKALSFGLELALECGWETLAIAAHYFIGW